MVVAGRRGAAVLVELRRAHLAAPTAVWHRAHTWRADQGLGGTVTLRWAASHHLEEGEDIIRRDRSEGIYRGAYTVDDVRFQWFAFVSGNISEEKMAKPEPL